MNSPLGSTKLFKQAIACPVEGCSMKEAPPWGTLPRLLRSRASEHPDVVIVVDEEVQLTLSELRDMASATARRLMARNIGHGDRVAIYAPNCWQWVVAAFGVWDCGGIVVPINTRARGIEAVEILRNTNCRALISIDDFLGRSYVQDISSIAGQSADGRPFAELPELETVLLVNGGSDRVGILGWDDFFDSAEQVDLDRAEQRALGVQPDDAFEILMTSGTTGQPKGVVLSGSQILRAYWDWAEVCGLGPGDRLPVVSPFAHGFGINAGLVVCVARLATMIPVAVFDPDEALQLVERLKITTLAGPPNLFGKILTNPELRNKDISTLRWAVIGAASVPDELVHAMYERLGFERVTNAYGLIEGSVVTMTRPGDPVRTVATSAGRVMPGMEIRLADDGSPRDTDSQGELQIRGYGVMQGYWNSPALTSAAFTEDGWLRTGDIGSIDSAGNLRIVGRQKEMMIVGGFNAYPAEIENLLLHNRQLAQAAVIGVSDDVLGEVPWAFVTPVEGAGPEEAEIIAWSRQNMSNYKVPRRVFVLDALPVTPNGKIAKTELAAYARPFITAD
ncbi:AMP-binding protein [Nocardia sp. NPDC003963]